MLKPIVDYDKYFYCSNRVYGFSSEGIEQVEFIDTKDEPVQITDFFRHENIIYMTQIIFENQGTEEEPVMENVNYYYKQVKGKVTQIENLPDRPEQEYSEFGSSNWEIEKVVFEDGFVSNVTNLFFKGQSRFIKISGYYEGEEGLFYNVLESGKPGLQEGLYYFPKEKTSPTRINDKGEIW